MSDIESIAFIAGIIGLLALIGFAMWIVSK